MRVLVIEDDLDDTLIMRTIIETDVPDAHVTTRTIPLSDPRQYLEYDALIFDELIGPYFGSEVAALVRRMGFKGPIFIVSGKGNVEKNFNEYLNKENIKNLGKELSKYFK